MNKVSLIVTYYPKIISLKKLVSDLLNENTKIIIIDNSNEGFDSEGEIIFNKCDIHNLFQNYGIAKAQNLGLEFSEKYDPEYILYFDQDSMIGSNYINQIIKPLENGYDISCPLVIDESLKFVYKPIIINRNGYPCKAKIIDDNFISIDYSISSGTAIHYETLVSIGGFLESFFIDFVDTEWFLRAKHLKFKTSCNPQAKLYHKIGDKSLDFKIFNLQLHSPFRTYYKTRNCLYLFKIKYIPILYKIRELIIVIIFNLITITISKQRRKHLNKIYLGIKDGFSPLKNI